MTTKKVKKKPGKKAVKKPAGRRVKKPVKKPVMKAVKKKVKKKADLPAVIPPGVIPGTEPLKNIRWEMWAQHFQYSNNATAAAVYAGYSVKWATKQGSRMYTNVDILARIQYLRSGVLNDLKIKGDAILLEMFNIGTSSIKPVLLAGFSYSPRFAAICNLPDHVLKQIKSIKETQWGIAVEFYDKIRAGELIGRYLDLWKETGASDEAARAQTNEEFEIMYSMRMTLAKYKDGKTDDKQNKPT